MCAGSNIYVCSNIPHQPEKILKLLQMQTIYKSCFLPLFEGSASVLLHIEIFNTRCHFNAGNWELGNTGILKSSIVSQNGGGQQRMCYFLKKKQNKSPPSKKVKSGEVNPRKVYRSYTWFIGECCVFLLALFLKIRFASTSSLYSLQRVQWLTLH